MKMVDVANFYIETGKINKDARTTDLRIGFLMYLSYGLYYAKTNKALFDENIELHSHGIILGMMNQSFIRTIEYKLRYTYHDFKIENMDREMFEFLSYVNALFYKCSTDELKSIVIKSGSPLNKEFFTSLTTDSLGKKHSEY